MRRSIVGCCILAALLSAGCSRQEAAWEEADRRDSIAAYDEYLARFPAGTHAGEARARLRARRDAEAWARAERIGSPEAWQRYLGDWPQGRMAPVALRRLAGFFPAESPAMGGRWLAQLGAYASESAAREGLARALREQGGLLGGTRVRVVPPLEGSPPVWRVRTAPLTEDAARRICASFLAAGAGCVPVADSGSVTP